MRVLFLLFKQQCDCLFLYSKIVMYIIQLNYTYESKKIINIKLQFLSRQHWIKNRFTHLQKSMHKNHVHNEWLRSRAIVTKVKLLLDRTTNSSTRMTSHFHYSSTHLISLVNPVRRWRQLVSFQLLWPYMFNYTVYFDFSMIVQIGKR